METKFLTPIQLWQDYNPIKDLLETAVINYSKIDEDITCKSLYFTAIGSGEDVVRVYAEVFIPAKTTKKSVIVLPDAKQGIPREDLIKYAKEGFISASVDLCGEEAEGFTDYTKYKGKYAYGQYSQAISNIKNCSPTAEYCPVFLWSKIVRRFLTVLLDDYPKIEPICIAECGASEIAWHLAAMDTRIIGAVTILGRSFGNFVGWNKATREDTDDNSERWETAISASAYAKFVGCPMLIVTATNSATGEFDRLESIMGLMPKDNVSHTLVTARHSKQITEEIDKTIIKWVKNRYENRKSFPQIPELKYRTLEDLEFLISPDETERKVTGVELFYSYNEECAEYRNWRSVEMAKEESGYSANIEISEADIRVYAYAVIKYRELQVSSSPIMLMLDRMDIRRIKLPKVKLIYDTGMENCFYAETEGVVLSSDILEIKKSDIGIPGIGVKEGLLASYIVGEDRRLKYEGILQISAYSDNATEVTIRLTRLFEGSFIEYSATRNIEAGSWEKLSFEADDFRTDERIPMEDWEGIKKIEFIDAEGVLFNNMLWV